MAATWNYGSFLVVDANTEFNRRAIFRLVLECVACELSSRTTFTPWCHVLETTLLCMDPDKKSRDMHMLCMDPDKNSQDMHILKTCIRLVLDSPFSQLTGEQGTIAAYLLCCVTVSGIWRDPSVWATPSAWFTLAVLACWLLLVNLFPAWCAFVRQCQHRKGKVLCSCNSQSELRGSGTRVLVKTLHHTDF